MKKISTLTVLFISIFSFSFCSENNKQNIDNSKVIQDSIAVESESTLPDIRDSILPQDIIIEKKLLYDQHTLADTYPYKDTTRSFQWDKIKERLALLKTITQQPSRWAILQNYKNKNGEAPLVKKYKRNVYKRIADTLDVERYQSVPLYLPGESTPELYGRDGSLVRYMGDSADFIKVETICFKGEWMVPKRYVVNIADSIIFNKAIFVDVTNQNITSLEKVDSKWLIRSMNPATTGRHNPPYAQETPLGIFVIEEKKPKMIYLVDGSTATGGFAPWASRFTNGAYIHGVPVNAPNTKTVEFSPSLGTIPRSHMCVRNATSHAKFIYDWAILTGTLVFVLD